MSRTGKALLAACFALAWGAALQARPPVEEDKAPAKTAQDTTEIPMKGNHYTLKNATVASWEKDLLRLVPESTTRSNKDKKTTDASKVKVFEVGLKTAIKTMNAKIYLYTKGSIIGTRCVDFDDLKAQVKKADAKGTENGTEDYTFAQVNLGCTGHGEGVCYPTQDYYLAEYFRK